MKRFLTLMLLTVTYTVGAWTQTLVLHHANGTTTDVELFTQPKVQFQNDKVLIVSTVLSMEYPKTDILRFTYKGDNKGGTVGINTPHDKVNMSRNGDRLVFHGMKPSDKISVYTAKGIRIPVNISHNGTSATIPLSSVPSGIYLLSINGRTSKFSKQ